MNRRFYLTSLSLLSFALLSLPMWRQLSNQPLAGLMSRFSLGRMYRAREESLVSEQPSNWRTT
jgi:hypothetical protein